MNDALSRLYNRVPTWVTTGTISRPQAAVVCRLLEQLAPSTVVEVGTASGVSAAIMAAALTAIRSDWQIHTLDVAQTCYFDESKLVGQAAFEMLGEEPRLSVHRGANVRDLSRILSGVRVDFAYIDGSHSSPWAAVDLLGLLPFLSSNAVVALDDVELPFLPGYKHQNASRDLFRMWTGTKWRHPGVPNLGILRLASREQALSDIATCLLSDWDALASEEDIRTFVELLKPFDEVRYASKDECRMLLSEIGSTVAGGNSYVRASNFPFATSSILHPSAAGDEAVVAWRRIPTDGAARLVFTACAFNEDDRNPGARLDVRYGSRADRMSVVSHKLKPMLPRMFELPLGEAETVDLEMIARSPDGVSADFTGISVSRLTLERA
jgi:predicted O-methyltransferase YrrM